MPCRYGRLLAGVCPPKPSLPQAEPALFPQLLLHHLWDLYWTLFCLGRSFSYPWGPNTGWSSRCDLTHAKWRGIVLLSSGCCYRPVCCKPGLLLGCAAGWWSVFCPPGHLGPSQQHCPQPVLMQRVRLLQVQDLAFVFTELPEAPAGLFLPSRSLWLAICCSWSGCWRNHLGVNHARHFGMGSRRCVVLHL